MRRADVAGLTVRLAGGADGDGGGEGPLVVLLHGFGAPGDDLTPLWRAVDAPRGTRWAFPAAPLALPSGPAGGRAWWWIDIERRLSSAERGDLDGLAREVPAGMSEARERVQALLDDLNTRLLPSKIVLGGFSQGAMLACDLALRSDQRLAGIALLSTTLIASDEWAPLASRRRGMPALQAHGTEDPLLPFAYAERVRDLLRAGGVDVDWVPFRGGHEISGQVLDRFGRWLRSTLE